MKRVARGEQPASTETFTGSPTTALRPPTWTPFATFGTRTACGMAATQRCGDMDGALWGSVDHWKEGIITRGVLLDVPKHRGEPYVTMEKPVHGWELEDIAKEQGVTMEPGRRINCLQRTGKVEPRRQSPLGQRLDGPPGSPRIVSQIHPGIGLLLAGMGHDGLYPQRIRPGHGRSTAPSSPTASACWTMRCSSRWRKPAWKRAATSFCSPSTPFGSWAEPAPRSTPWPFCRSPTTRRLAAQPYQPGCWAGLLDMKLPAELAGGCGRSSHPATVDVRLGRKSERAD